MAYSKTLESLFDENNQLYRHLYEMQKDYHDRTMEIAERLKCLQAEINDVADGLTALSECVLHITNKLNEQNLLSKEKT